MNACCYFQVVIVVDTVGETCLFVETVQFTRNYGGVVVATVVIACSGS